MPTVAKISHPRGFSAFRIAMPRITVLTDDQMIGLSSTT